MFDASVVMCLFILLVGGGFFIFSFFQSIIDEECLHQAIPYNIAVLFIFFVLGMVFPGEPPHYDPLVWYSIAAVWFYIVIYLSCTIAQEKGK